MKGLLIKDFKALLLQKQFILILTAFSIFLTYSSNDPGIVSGYLLMCLSILTLNTMSYDEANGGMSFILSLPVTRKLYVKSKYALALSLITLGTLLSVAIAFIVSIIKDTKLDTNSYIPSVIGCVVAAAILIVFLVPIQLKVGAEKARLALFVVAGVIALIVGGVYKIATDVLKIDLKKVLSDLTLKLSKLGNIDIVITVILLVIIAVLFVISYLFSIKIMKKKEY